MTKSPTNYTRPLILLAGILYPFLVFVGIDKVPPSFFVFISIFLIGIRFFRLGKTTPRRFLLPVFAIIIIIMLGLFFLSPHLAVKAYPILMSLLFAGVFGYSLLSPPTVIERIARISEPDLPPEGVAYTRRVTIIWLGFLLINAAISLMTALWGSTQQWTLWNGLLSYLCMGVLFAGEFCVRKIIRT